MAHEALLTREQLQWLEHLSKAERRSSYHNAIRMAVGYIHKLQGIHPNEGR